MEIRRLHHLWTIVRLIRPWYFLVIGLICLIVSVFALRDNNLHMVKLRDAVYTADKNNGDVPKALMNLQHYVTAHMNTNLTTGSSIYPPIQLKYTYERLRAAQFQTTNEQVYNDAQKYCEAQNSTDFSGRNRVPCIESYVESHGVQPKQIPDAMYKFDFISPVWSPDLAGWSLVATLFFFLFSLVWWLFQIWLKRRVS
jgi:preprotein translocase subunit SecF